MRKIFGIILVSFPMLLEGQHWQGFGNYFQFSVMSLAGDTNYLYAGQTYPSGNSNIISKWNGNIWDSAGTHCVEQPRKLIMYQGNLISDACDGILSAYDGTNWLSFGYPNDKVMGMDVYGNDLYVTGYFDSISGVSCSQIATWNGSVWTAIDTTNWNLFGSSNCSAIYQGDLYMGGNFINYNGSIKYIARWNGNQWNSMSGIDFHGLGGVNCMSVYKGELYVGGLLKGVLPGGYGNGIVRWNGTRWDDLQGGLGSSTSQVLAMLSFNGYLYVAGNFTSVANGIPAYSIARWDGNSWCSLGSYFDNAISALAVYDNSIVVGGGFWTIDGDSINYVAKWIGNSYVDSCSAPNEVNEYPTIPRFHFFPNPASESIIVNCSLKSTVCHLIISDAVGRVLKVEKLEANTFQKQLDVSDLSKGFYFLTFEAGGGRVTKRMIKQ